MIKLGDEVRCKVTGFKGVATSRQIHMNGCNHVCIQPKIKKDGTLPESQWFDEIQVEVTKPKTPVKKKSFKGGPMRSGAVPRIKADWKCV
jgi:hypothetical protein